MHPREQSSLGRGCAAYPSKAKRAQGSSLPTPVFASDGTYLVNAKIPVAMRSGDTPVPIPNTKVKPGAADGTALETVRESRRLPD